MQFWVIGVIGHFQCFQIILHRLSHERLANNLSYVTTWKWTQSLQDIYQQFLTGTSYLMSACNKHGPSQPRSVEPDSTKRFIWNRSKQTMPHLSSSCHSPSDAVMAILFLRTIVEYPVLTPTFTSLSVALISVSSHNYSLPIDTKNKQHPLSINDSIFVGITESAFNVKSQPSPYKRRPSNTWFPIRVIYKAKSKTLVYTETTTSLQPLNPQIEWNTATIIRIWRKKRKEQWQWQSTCGLAR